MYADDVQIYLSYPIGMVEDATVRLNMDLMRVDRWAEANRLKLNPIKCQAIVISKNIVDTSCLPQIILGSSVVEYVKTVKNLGLIFNQTLTWDDQIACALGKTYGALRTLYVSCNCLPIHIKIILVKTLVFPILFYGSLIFCSLDSVNERKLRVAFNNVVRFVYGLRRFDHVSRFTNTIFNMPLHDYLNSKILIFLFKLMQSGTPEYLFEKLVFSRSQRSRVLINPPFKYTVSKRQFFVYAVGLWNALPVELRRISNLQNFTKTLNNHLKC